MSNLNLLKQDLQMLTSANDEYLTYLLEVSKAAIQREGVYDDDSADYNGVVVSYAAYLYRKRAASTAHNKDARSETEMPRFVRLMLNNLAISQKARRG